MLAAALVIFRLEQSADRCSTRSIMADEALDRCMAERKVDNKERHWIERMNRNADPSFERDEALDQSWQVATEQMKTRECPKDKGGSTGPFA